MTCFTRNKLPILVYHSIQEKSWNGVTTSLASFGKHLKFFADSGYTSLFFSDLKNVLPKKPVVITFDDGYHDNLLAVQPLLQKYSFKATIFIPSSKIGIDEDKMDLNQLKLLDRNIFDLALHSHSHRNYAEMSIGEIEDDLLQNIRFFSENDIDFSKVLAYPFGKFPKSAEFFALLKKLEIEYAVRIGNKINSLPLRNNFELQRINADGIDSLPKFRYKLLFGDML